MAQREGTLCALRLFLLKSLRYRRAPRRVGKYVVIITVYSDGATLHQPARAFLPRLCMRSNKDTPSLLDREPFEQQQG